MERNFEPQEALDLLYKYDYLRIQVDGAKSFIKKVKGAYNVMILNEKTGRMVTAMKGLCLKKVIGLGKNYGWELEN